LKCAVLCNGPSRKSYTPSAEYDYVIGCNIPWTDVDSTVILDKLLVDVWNKERSLIQCKVYFSEQTWAYAKSIDPVFFNQHFAGTLVTESHYHSSGHQAVELAIDLGYTDIDVYGCDAYFNTRNFDSFTREFIPLDSPNQVLRAVDKMTGWKVRWSTIIRTNPKVKLNFKR